MGVGGVSGGSATADLMKILEAGQAQTLDLAKKMIKINQQDAVNQVSEEGKGQYVDLMA